MWASRSSSDFLLPDAPPTPPVPTAQTYSSGPGTGTITFSAPLDTSITLDPADWFRGLGSFRRPVVTMSYSSATVIAINSMGSNAGIDTPNGWKYVPGSNPIKGANGATVAAFEGFTG